jgi:hypothetical protein
MRLQLIMADCIKAISAMPFDEPFHHLYVVHPQSNLSLSRSSYKCLTYMHNAIVLEALYYFLMLAFYWTLRSDTEDFLGHFRGYRQSNGIYHKVGICSRDEKRSHSDSVLSLSFERLRDHISYIVERY